MTTDPPDGGVDPADRPARIVEARRDRTAAPLLIARACVEQLGVSGAGASVVSAGSRALLCATDERAEWVEDLQFTLGVGPCVDAVAQGLAVCVPDVCGLRDDDAERWPGFLDALSAAGVRAVFSLPLRLGTTSIGALDLHRTSPGALSGNELRRAHLAAEQMASALVSDVGVVDAGQLAWPGPAYGMHVHQATGMVQVQLDVSTAEALLALRARAFADDRTVSELARDVVERRVRFERGEAR